MSRFSAQPACLTVNYCSDSGSHKLKSKVYRGQNEKSNLVNRTADDVSNSSGIARSASRLFPDEPGFQYCRCSQYHRSSTVEPLGGFSSSWTRLLDRQQ